MTILRTFFSTIEIFYKKIEITNDGFHKYAKHTPCAYKEMETILVCPISG